MFLYVGMKRKVFTNQDFRPKEMKEFIVRESSPLIFMPKGIHPTIVLESVTKSPKPKVLVYFDPKMRDLKSFFSSLETVAEGWKRKMLFSVDPYTEEHQDLLKFGVDLEELPAILIMDDYERMKYVIKHVGENTIETSLEDYEDGRLDPFISSVELVPRELQGPVKVLNGQMFQKIVFHSGKNVLLLVHSTNGAATAEKYDDVAIALKDEKSVIVARIELDYNDIPGRQFILKGTYTFYFVNSHGIIYEFKENFSVENLKNFVLDHKLEYSASISPSLGSESGSEKKYNTMGVRRMSSGTNNNKNNNNNNINNKNNKNMNEKNRKELEAAI